jgi:two-component system response regulator (stage 0 sporulation protein F)
MSITQWVEEFLAKPSRLLIVDDQEGVAEMIQRSLHGYDCEFVAVGDGESAIREIQRTKFDLIFLDIVLPGINGIEVLKHVKKVAPETPVVIMTGYFDGRLLDEASRVGIVSFLRKPIDFTPEFVKHVFHLFKLRGGPKQSIFAYDDFEPNQALTTA